MNEAYHWNSNRTFGVLLSRIVITGVGYKLPLWGEAMAHENASTIHALHTPPVPVGYQLLPPKIHLNFHRRRKDCKINTIIMVAANLFYRNPCKQCALLTQWDRSGLMGCAASQFPRHQEQHRTPLVWQCLTSVYMLTFISRFGQAIHAWLIDYPMVTVHFWNVCQPGKEQDSQTNDKRHWWTNTGLAEQLLQWQTSIFRV